MKKRPTILVVRRDEQFSILLRENGFEVLNLELIAPEPLADLSELRSRLGVIDRYDGLFFTSPAAAAVFVSESETAGTRFGGKIYALGERAKKVLEGAGFEVQYRNSANTAEELVKEFGDDEFEGKRLLFVRGDRSLRTIPTLLGGIAEVHEVVVYETRAIRPRQEAIRLLSGRMKNSEIDWVCFFSPSGVEAFRKLFASELTANLKAAAIGETTARAAADAGLRVGLVAKKATAADFAACVQQTSVCCDEATN